MADLVTGQNDLETLFPEIARQLVGADPSELTTGSGRRSTWICNDGHSYDSRVADRVRGQGCPYCAGKRTVVGETDLATTHPELAAQANGWDATVISHGSSKKLSWKCAKGHKWDATVSSRTKGVGCPYCSGKRAIVGETDLATTHPELAAQANGWDATVISHGSSKKLSWKCAKGHKWDATVSSRTKGVGCPYCWGRFPIVGETDLATTHPELAAQANGWDATTVSRGSDKRMEWKCQLGHEWTSVVGTRTQDNLGCPICGNQKLLKGFNDLETTHPELAAEADGWDPSTVFAGSHKKADWKCNLGHSWSAQIGSRAAGKSCPVCAGRVVLPGFNDLKTLFPEIASEADSWDTTTVSVGSHKKLPWKCDFGHQWSTQVKNRVSGFGCPVCARTGFDPSREGWLYFLEHDDWDMYQIGITNVPDQRLSTHRKSGWLLKGIRGPMDGSITYKWEQSIRKSLKKHGADLGKGRKGGFDGYTEAWPKGSFPAKSIEQLLDLVHEDEIPRVLKKD